MVGQFSSASRTVQARPSRWVAHPIGAGFLGHERCWIGLAGQFSERAPRRPRRRVEVAAAAVVPGAEVSGRQPSGCGLQRGERDLGGQPGQRLAGRQHQPGGREVVPTGAGALPYPAGRLLRFDPKRSDAHAARNTGRVWRWHRPVARRRPIVPASRSRRPARPGRRPASRSNGNVMTSSGSVTCCPAARVCRPARPRHRPAAGDGRPG